MTTFKKSISALAVATSLGLAIPAYADNTTANITGAITANDYSQYAVTATNPKTGVSRNVSVSDSGSFRFSQLPTGQYDITITKNGALVAKDTARITLGSNASLEFNFLTDEGTEVIEVTSARISAVDVTSTDSGLVIGELDVDRMPISRNITAIAMLAPGTVEGENNFSSPNSGGLASFGGASVAENSCYIKLKHIYMVYQIKC